VKLEKWNEYLEKSKTWKLRMPFELLHSEAYKALTYGPSLKVLCWFWEKREVRVNRRRRGNQRYEVVNNGRIVFDYFEAGYRGLSHHQFRKALLDLHALGFIDVTKPGSALKDDYALYGLSDRWKKYGTDQFEKREFPRSVHWTNSGFGGLVDPKEAQKRKKLSVDSDT